MKASDMRNYTDQELRAMIAENRKTLAELRFNNRVSPVENPARMRMLKRDIARLNTILSERKHAAPASSAPLGSAAGPQEPAAE